jgi:hypothetical protein
LLLDFIIDSRIELSSLYLKEGDAVMVNPCFAIPRKTWKKIKCDCPVWILGVGGWGGREKKNMVGKGQTKFVI